MKLVNYMAKSCCYAQDSTFDFDINAMERVSYQMSCFLAQNTVYGNDGVDWDIAKKDLIGKKKTEEEWVEFFNKQAKELGGWN